VFIVLFQTRGLTYLDFFTFFGWPIILGNWISTKLKSGNLLVGMARKGLNVD
jgi:hypothetical protein